MFVMTDWVRLCICGHRSGSCAHEAGEREKGLEAHQLAARGALDIVPQCQASSHEAQGVSILAAHLVIPFFVVAHIVPGGYEDLLREEVDRSEGCPDLFSCPIKQQGVTRKSKRTVLFLLPFILQWWQS